MGMFDTIIKIPVKCPRCGDTEPKSAQNKSGPQWLAIYEFGKDRIPLHWDYNITKKNKIISGIATCKNCKAETNAKFDEIVEEMKKSDKYVIPPDAKYLVEGKFDGEDTLKIALDRLDDFYGGNHHIELFDVEIDIVDEIAVSVRTKL